MQELAPVNIVARIRDATGNIIGHHKGVGARHLTVELGFLSSAVSQQSPVE